MNNNSQRVLKGIGWLEVIIGALGVLSSIWFIFIGVMYSCRWVPDDDCGLGGLFVLNLFWSLPLAILFFLGVGILRLRSWVRVAHIIIFLIIFAVELFFFLLFVSHSHPYFLRQIPGILIPGSIIWFLSRPAVKKQFK